MEFSRGIPELLEISWLALNKLYLEPTKIQLTIKALYSLLSELKENN